MFKFIVWVHENLLFQWAEARRRPLVDSCHGDVWYWVSINVAFVRLWPTCVTRRLWQILYTIEMIGPVTKNMVNFFFLHNMQRRCSLSIGNLRFQLKCCWNEQLPLEVQLQSLAKQLPAEVSSCWHVARYQKLWNFIWFHLRTLTKLFLLSQVYCFKSTLTHHHLPTLGLLP